MRRASAAFLLAVAAVAAPAVASQPPVRLTGSRTAVVGRTWIAVVVAPVRPAVVARSGSSTRRASLARAGRGRWRASVRFPTPGRWTLTATLRGRRYALGGVVVRPAPAPPVRLVDALDVVVEPAGTILIADAGDRVLRGDPANGRLSVVARLPLPIEVALSPAGEIAVASGNRIAVVGASIRTLAEVSEPRGLAFDPNGNLFVSELNGGVRRITSGGASTVFAADLSQPHGLAMAPGGALYVADTGNGRVRRIASDGSAATVAAGLSTPVDVALAADGTLYVAEFGANRIASITSDGGVATLASLPGTSGVAVAPDGAVWATQRSGPVSRIDPATGAVTAVFR